MATENLADTLITAEGLAKFKEELLKEFLEGGGSRSFDMKAPTGTKYSVQEFRDLAEGDGFRVLSVGGGDDTPNLETLGLTNVDKHNLKTAFIEKTSEHFYQLILTYVDPTGSKNDKYIQYFLTVRDTETGTDFIGSKPSLEFVIPFSGISRMTQLEGVPSTFAKQAGKLLMVNDTEDGVQFVDQTYILNQLLKKNSFFAKDYIGLSVIEVKSLADANGFYPISIGDGNKIINIMFESDTTTEDAVLAEDIIISKSNMSNAVVKLKGDKDKTSLKTFSVLADVTKNLPQNSRYIANEKTNSFYNSLSSVTDLTPTETTKATFTVEVGSGRKIASVNLMTDEDLEYDSKYVRIHSNDMSKATVIFEATDGSKLPRNLQSFQILSYDGNDLSTADDEISIDMTAVNDTAEFTPIFKFKEIVSAKIDGVDGEAVVYDKDNDLNVITFPKMSISSGASDSIKLTDVKIQESYLNKAIHIDLLGYQQNKLEEISFNGFGKLTNFNGMFKDNQSSNIHNTNGLGNKIIKFDVSNGVVFDEMFYLHNSSGAINYLTRPNLKEICKLDTSNGVSFVRQFSGQKELLILFGIDTRKAFNTQDMFAYCGKLKHPNTKEQALILKGAKYSYDKVKDIGTTIDREGTVYTDGYTEAEKQLILKYATNADKTAYTDGTIKLVELDTKVQVYRPTMEEAPESENVLFRTGGLTLDALKADVTEFKAMIPYAINRDVADVYSGDMEYTAFKTKYKTYEDIIKAVDKSMQEQFKAGSATLDEMKARQSELEIYKAKASKTDYDSVIQGKISYPQFKLLVDGYQDLLSKAYKTYKQEFLEGKHSLADLQKHVDEYTLYQSFATKKDTDDLENGVIDYTQYKKNIDTYKAYKEKVDPIYYTEFVAGTHTLDELKAHSTEIDNYKAKAFGGDTSDMLSGKITYDDYKTKVDGYNADVTKSNADDLKLFVAGTLTLQGLKTKIAGYTN